MPYSSEQPLIEPKLAIIVAAAKNRVIGFKNALPWYLPEELAHFKRTTFGKPIIMGRKTFESIGKPLPGRLNIVVSRNLDFVRPGIIRVSSLQMAIKQARAQALLDGVEEIMLIGGEQLYTQGLPLAQRLYLTQVDAEPEGDAWFPELAEQEWQEISSSSYPSQGGNRYAYTIYCLERASAEAADDKDNKKDDKKDDKKDKVNE